MYGTPHLQCNYAVKQCKIISQRLSTKRQSSLKWCSVSTFQKQANEKHEVNENVLEKTFTAIYWLAKRISNQNLIPLLKAHSNGVGALYSLLPRAVDGGTRLFQASRSNLNLARSPTTTRKFLATCFPRTYQAWQKTSPVVSMIACPFWHPSPF